MFRIIIFIYEISVGNTKPTLSSVLSYFLLFPNSCSTLFPVVDFKTMNQSYYGTDPLDTYSRGARRIVRGLLQLLVYRLVFQLLSLEPEHVASGTEVVQFILASTLVYTQVSGYFHVVTGLLMLFGFDLPETNRRYLLASSFTDYWRRINIYWKDFILKVFYYPTFFRLKDRGTTKALVVATAWSFFITWALHLYQTWWIKGAAPISAPDALFWGVLGMLVLVNSLWEMKRGRQRKLKTSTRQMSIRSAIALMLRTAGTFACISLLWSLWSTPTLRQWLAIWQHADYWTVVWSLASLAGIMLATLAFEIRPRRLSSVLDAFNATQSYTKRLAFGAVPLAVVILAGLPSVQAKFLRPSTQPLIDAVNTGDALSREIARGGYYESLANVNGANVQLWETLTGQRVASFYRYQGAHPVQTVNDFRFEAALPNLNIEAYDTTFRTNSWGMREDEYSLTKSAGTSRVAVLGSSHTMGWGVAKEEVFSTLLQRRLNANPPAGGRRFEVLNFAFLGWSPLAQLAVAQELASKFNPDVVLFAAHSVDAGWACRDLSKALRERVPLGSAFLEGVASAARVTKQTNLWIAQDRLTPHCEGLVVWAYERLAHLIRSIGAAPVAVLLPIPNDVPVKRERFLRQAALLRAAGFRVLDLSDIYEGLSKEQVRLNEKWWGGEQGHTNAFAHRRIAKRLYNAWVSAATRPK
jgi:D-alanyl-lipoteichoic acid acyltransferase DltB (MBOAT superfamily)